MRRIYTPQSIAVGVELLLEDAPSHHLVQVLRLSVGDTCVLFNGHGQEFITEIVGCHKKTARVKILGQRVGCPPSSLQLHLGQALSKGDRMDYAVQKAVELGVSEITPLYTNHCSIKWDEERFLKKQVHWQNIAVSALEQSGRCDFVTIHPVQRLESWLRDTQATYKWCLHFEGGKTPAQVTGKQTLVALVVGPEGGWTDEEVGLAKAVGFETWRLGPRVLRTETAPVVALSVLQYLAGDLTVDASCAALNF